MRKLFTLFLSCTFAAASFAQSQLTNNGFESWTNGIPDGWSTTKSIVSSSSLETQDTIDPYAGHSALKIVTGSVGSPIDTLSGFVHYGQVQFQNSNAGYYPNFYNEYTQFPCEPDSIRFAYKYTSVGGDEGGLEFYISNRLIDGYPLPATATYQVLTLGFVGGTLTHITDSLSLSFYSSYSLSQPLFHAGSTLWLDSITFIYNNGAADCLSSNGVNEVGANLPLRVYPNPANNAVTLSVMSSEIGSEVQIYDRIGREVYAGTLDQTTYSIPTAQMESGYYSLRVIKDGIITHTSAMAILH